MRRLQKNSFVRYISAHLQKQFFVMETQLNKDERIEIRISPQDKKIFKKAQELSGDRSFSSFIVRIIKARAEEIVC